MWNPAFISFLNLGCIHFFRWKKCTLVLYKIKQQSVNKKYISTAKKKTTKIRLQNTPIRYIGQLFLVNFHFLIITT